jgi:hypothetical protein
MKTSSGGIHPLRRGITRSLQKTDLQMQKYSAIHVQNKPEANVSGPHQQ